MQRTLLIAGPDEGTLVYLWDYPVAAVGCILCFIVFCIFVLYFIALCFLCARSCRVGWDVTSSMGWQVKAHPGWFPTTVCLILYCILMYYVILCCIFLSSITSFVYWVLKFASFVGELTTAVWPTAVDVFDMLNVFCHVPLYIMYVPCSVVFPMSLCL